MFLIYTLDAGNTRSPSERTVHCVDTDLPERFFVVDSTQGDHARKKTVDQLSDFIGDLTKDLTKPVLIAGVDGDAFGSKIIEDYIRSLPVYVTMTLQYATINRLFRRS